MRLHPLSALPVPAFPLGEPTPPHLEPHEQALLDVAKLHRAVLELGAQLRHTIAHGEVLLNNLRDVAGGEGPEGRGWGGVGWGGYQSINRDTRELWMWRCGLVRREAEACGRIGD